MRRLMIAVMLYYRKATCITDDSNYIPLNLVDRAQLSMHFSLCSGCRNYPKQNRVLERLLKRHAYTAAISAQNTNELEDRFIRNIGNNK